MYAKEKERRKKRRKGGHFTPHALSCSMSNKRVASNCIHFQLLQTSSSWQLLHTRLSLHACICRGVCEKCLHVVGRWFQHCALAAPSGSDWHLALGTEWTCSEWAAQWLYRFRALSCLQCFLEHSIGVNGSLLVREVSVNSLVLARRKIHLSWHYVRVQAGHIFFNPHLHVCWLLHVQLKNFKLLNVAHVIYQT